MSEANPEKDDSFSLLCGGHSAMTISIVKSSQTFWARKDEGYNGCLTNTLKTADGKTVGQMNREWLHKRFDEFLDKGEFE